MSFNCGTACYYTGSEISSKPLFDEVYILNIDGTYDTEPEKLKNFLIKAYGMTSNFLKKKEDFDFEMWGKKLKKNHKILLIFPGGKCSKWDEILGDISQKISDFVNTGGFYLGLCAGAYYVCSESEYRINEEQILLKRRGINFFDGVGIGPITTKKSVTVEKKQEACTSFFSNGGYFKPYRSSEHMPLFYYREADKGKVKKLAGLVNNIGQGKVVLTFLHLLFDSENHKLSSEVKRESWMAELFEAFYSDKELTPLDTKEKLTYS